MKAMSMMSVEQYVPKSSRLKILYLTRSVFGGVTPLITSARSTNRIHSSLALKTSRELQKLAPLLEDSSCDNQNNGRIPPL